MAHCEHEGNIVRVGSGAHDAALRGDVVPVDSHDLVDVEGAHLMRSRDGGSGGVIVAI